MNSQTHHTGHVPAEAVLAGSSPAVERLRLQIARFGPHFRILLLSGESGTGKRFIAQSLHGFGSLVSQPVLPQHLAEFAESPHPPAAILLLHGLSDLKNAARLKVIERLRLLSREARVVITCATNPGGPSAAARFKAEAQGKAGLLEIPVPPLRERLEDLAAIAAAVVPAREEVAFEQHHLDLLGSHGWPGNLNEFARVYRHFLATGELRIDDTPAPGPIAMQPLETVISDHVARVLEHCAGNKFRAAEILGISRSTLYRML